jgi:hypothetical protein
LWQLIDRYERMAEQHFSLAAMPPFHESPTAEFLRGRASAFRAVAWRLRDELAAIPFTTN